MKNVLTRTQIRTHTQTQTQTPQTPRPVQHIPHIKHVPKFFIGIGSKGIGSIGSMMCSVMNSAVFMFMMTLGLLFVIPAQAYYSVMDTGEVTPVGRYRFTLEPQMILNNLDGVNLVAHFDTGLTPSSGIRAKVGIGDVDFQIGGFYKWIPYPNTPSQPALGADFGFLIAHFDDALETSFRVHPLISGRIRSDVGDFIPYASVPIGVTFRKDSAFVPVQLAGGVEWTTLKWDNLKFMLEMGLNIHRAFSYVSFGLAYDFGLNPTPAPGTIDSSRPKSAGLDRFSL